MLQYLSKLYPRVSMLYPPDIAVTAVDGRPQVDVEVKALLNRGPEWAADSRHRLMDYSSLPPYFGLAMPERLYFWKNGIDSTERLPDLELKTDQVLRGYFPAHWTSPEQWNSSDVLELAVAAWLGDLSWGNPKVLSTEWAHHLDEIGFLKAVRGAQVKFGIAA